MEKKDLVIGKKYLHKSKIEVYYLGEGNNKCSVVQPTNGVDGITSLRDSHPKIKDIIGNDRFWSYENIHLELKEIEPNLNLNELIVGEIYVSEVYNHPEWRSLFKCISNTNKAYSYKYRLYTSNDFHGNKLELHEYSFTDTNSHYKASKEESKWLNVCIKANKFIPKEDLDLYDDATFELKDLETKTKDNAFLDDLITRAVQLDNPNLIAEELGCTIQDIIDSKNDETYSCKKNQFDKLNSANCAGLSCYNNKCPFRSNSTIAEEWLLSKVNENKFEVGAWYYCESGFEWYFKYAKEDSDKVEFYEHIDIDSREFKKYDYLCYLTKKKIQNVRKVELSEIQEYLPDGHIDKTIKEFTLPEKWCIRQSAGEEVYKWFNKKYDVTSFPTGNYNYLVNSECSVYSDYIPQGYTEITFEQFKKYVLKDYIKESKEVILEYVECIGLLESKVQGWSNYYTIGKIYKNNFTSNDGFIYVIIGDDGEEWACEISQFKPSTKEAFDAQNKPKSIEKWSVGSYVVFLKDNLQANFRKRGDISEITHFNVNIDTITFKDGICNSIDGEFSVVTNLKWFATKSEAQEFSKTLLNKDDMFKKDDYIVITIPNQNNDGFITDFCYKQIDNDLYLRPELTTLGNIRNGWRLITYSSSHWRYATKEEVAKYDRLGKPFDVTTLNEKEELKVDSLSKLKNNKENYTSKVGDWVITDMMNIGSYYENKAYKVIELDTYHSHQPCFKITESDDGKACSWCYPYGDKKSVRKALSHEIPKIAKEELLKEAKRKYPIGCTYKSITSPSTYQLKSELEIDKYGNICDADRTCHVYLNNKWAEIIYEDLPYMNISFQPYFEVMVQSDECNSKLDLSLRDEKEVNVNEIKSSNNNISKLNLSLNN